MRTVVLADGGIKATVALTETLAKHDIERTYILDVRLGGEPIKQGFASVDIARWFVERGHKVERLLIDVADIFSFRRIENYRYPGKYAILVSSGLAIAQQFDATKIILGICDDWPDQKGTIDALKQVVHHHTNGNLQVVTPNSGKSYAEVIANGLAINAPLHLAWTCERDVYNHCLMCIACKKRISAVNELRDFPKLSKVSLEHANNIGSAY